MSVSCMVHVFFCLAVDSTRPSTVHDVSMASDQLERDLTKTSAGYLSKEDYKRKREELEREQALQALKKIAGAPAVSSSSEAATSAEGSADLPGDGIEEGDARAGQHVMSSRG